MKQFKLFIKNDFISFSEITENFCKRFRQFLFDKFTGSIPTDYYARFKWVINAAESDGYFQRNLAKKVQSKLNSSIRMKKALEVDEYLMLLNTPCLNEEVKAAFSFGCNTGLRWVEVKKSEVGIGEEEKVTGGFRPGPDEITLLSHPDVDGFFLLVLTLASFF